MTITHTYKEVAVIPEVRVPMILRDLGEIEKLGGVETWIATPVSFQDMLERGVNLEYIIDLFAKSHKVPSSIQFDFIQRCIMRLLPLLADITKAALASQIQLRTFRSRPDVNAIFAAFEATTANTPVWAATAFTASYARNARLNSQNRENDGRYNEELNQQIADIVVLTEPDQEDDE